MERHEDTHQVCEDNLAKSEDRIWTADFYPILQPPLIQQYLDANGIILGKTNLAEMQDTITSIQPTSNGINTPLNPYDPTRIAGGKLMMQKWLLIRLDRPGSPTQDQLSLPLLLTQRDTAHFVICSRLVSGFISIIAP